MMLVKLSWRNLWRNKRRSLVVLSSIIIGVAALLLNDALGKGMFRQMLDNQINTHVSHMQVHKSGFNDDKVITSFIPEPGKVEAALKQSKFVKNYSKRVITYGLVSSAKSSTGIALIGIEPGKEKDITDVHKFVIEGKYLAGMKNEILISRKIADKLEVGLGDKIIAVAADVNGDVSSELFRVAGIYRSPSSEFDKAFVYIPLQNAQKMLSLGDNVSEFAIVTSDMNRTLEYKRQLSASLDKTYEILTYQELLPMIMSYLEMYKSMIWIFYAIIAIAVLFGVVNTMLMSVFERIHEFGVLMSIGMKKNGIFIMVLQEAFVLGMFGTFIGFILGLLIFLPLAHTGIDFSMFSDTLQAMGIGSIIYPVMDIQIVLNSLIAVPVATVLGAIYPALKAIRLHPTDAMRYI